MLLGKIILDTKKDPIIKKAKGDGERMGVFHVFCVFNVVPLIIVL